MSNIVEMSKDEVRELSIDFDSHEAVQNGLTSLSGKVKGRDARNARAKYAIGVMADRMMVDHGMTAENVAGVTGMAGGTFSKLRTVAKVARYATSERGDESPYDDKLETMVGRLDHFWSLETNGQNVGSLRKHLDALVSDDGEGRAQSIGALYGALGSTEYFYKIAQGTKVHPSEEIDQDDDQDGDEGDEGDEPKVDGKELLTRGVRKCREQGMSDADILAFIATI